MSLFQQIRKFLIRKLNAIPKEAPSDIFLEKYYPLLEKYLITKNVIIPTYAWAKFTITLKKNKDSFDLAPKIKLQIKDNDFDPERNIDIVLT